MFPHPDYQSETERNQRAAKMAHFVAQVRGRLIVSCQALAHEPLHGAEIMARMAVAAHQGGAAAIRANGPADVAAICAAVPLPVIGLYKEDIPGYPVYITPTLSHALEIARAGAAMIAIDATDRSRPQPGTLADYIAAIHAQTDCLVLADVATIAEGVAAEAAGADMISTTMSGSGAAPSPTPRPACKLSSIPTNAGRPRATHAGACVNSKPSATCCAWKNRSRAGT